MTDESTNHGRLSQIDTLWSVVRRAHSPQAPEDSAAKAKEQLLHQYGGAIRRYLVGALRDQEAADDLFQEFSLKFINGDFRSADPDKGKFRAFLKTVLYRMVAMHFRTKGRRKELQADDRQLNELPDDDYQSETPSAAFEQQFTRSWRDELLAKTWESLFAYESNGGGPYHSALRIRVENLSADSDQIAQLISRKLGKPTKPGAARVMIHRSRAKFAELLVGVIRDSLGSDSREEVESELIELELIEYCREALDKQTEQKE